MIYRIVAEGFPMVISYEDGRLVGWILPGPLKGAGVGLGDVMWALGLPVPTISNRRARFYFTERGWDRYGRELTRAARQRGQTVKVIRRKNPRKSQIVYQDEIQLAVLPGLADRLADAA
jgi:hypothetical protein